MSDQKKKNSAYNNFLALHNSINKRLDQRNTNAQKGIPQDKPSVQSEASKKIATKTTGSKAKNAVTFTPAKTRQEYDSAIATGKKELSRLEELLSKKQDFGTFLRNTYTMTPAAASAQEAATRDAWAKEYGYGSWKDAQNRYDLLKAETGQMEKELRYGYLSEEPDYKYFSALGASAKNPAMDEVEKWIGGADVANIVTYSRENADKIAMGESNNSRMKGRSIYQFMTDQEVQNYNYLLAKEGAESADGYLEFLEADLQKRQAEPWTESLQGIQNPVGKAVAQGAYGFAAGIDRAMSGYTPDQPTSAIQHTSQELQQDMSDVGRVFYSAAENVGNMAPSVLVSSLLGGIGAPAQLAQAAGNITMGTSVAGNAYKQAIEDGYGETQARNYGTLVGLSETMLQKLLGGISALGGISDTKIMASLSKIDSALLRGAAKLGVNLAGEIAEEELQNYLEPAFRTILFGEDYDAPTIDELVETALVTAITVGTMEGPMTVAETISEEVEETATLRESAPALVAASQELSGDTELGTRIQERIDSGQKVSGRDLRNLVAQNEQAIATQTATQAAAMLTERGETGNVAEVAQVVGKMATGQRLTRQEMQIFRESQNAADVLNEINEAEAITETPAQEVTETAQEAQIPTPVEVEGESRNVAVEAPVAPESASVPAPVAEVVEPAETDVKAAQGATLYEDEARELEANSQQYGEQAEDYIQSFDAGQNVAEYDTAWKAGYELGMSQVPQAQAMESSDLAYLTPGQRVDAYEAGLKAAGVMAEQKEARVQGMTRNATGARKRGIVRAYNGINTATLAQKFNDSQRKAYKILSTIADVTGIEIVLYESTPEADGVYREAQGKYIRSQPGRIFVDLNAGISHVSEVGDMANYTMLATFTHEFVHFCENWNPVRYNELRKAVFDAMAENNINVEERIDQLMAESNGELSREDASREAVAEALVEILPDANFVEQLANEHKTLFRKLLERLKEFLQEIKDYFSGMRKSNDPTVAALKEEVDGMTRYMEHIVKLFDNVAVEAVNRMQEAAMDGDTVSNTEAFTDSSIAVQNQIRPPYNEGTKAFTAFADGLNEEARKTFDMFYGFYDLSRINNATNLQGKPVKKINISAPFVSVAQWNDKVRNDAKWGETAKKLAAFLDADTRKRMNMNEDGTLNETPLEKAFKMQKSIAQRLVDSLPVEDIEAEYTIDDSVTVTLPTAKARQSVGGEAYRRALIGETRKLYHEGKLKQVSIGTMSKDRWGSLGFLAANGKTTASGDFTTVCPQMMFNKGCFYCYRRAAMESGVNNKLVAEKVWYAGEILRIKDKDIADLNRNGGLRIQSFGDWMPHFSAMLADVLYDAELRGLQVKIITKEPSMIEYLASLKDQGIGKNLYFNLSADYVLEKAPAANNTGDMDSLEHINPDRPFVRRDGQAWWKRAMAVEEAAKYRAKYDWVNTRIVATTTEEFIRGLKDPTVDVVTGYHGNIRQYDRIDSVTGQTQVEVEALGDAGMPRWVFLNDKWNLVYKGKTKTHQQLAERIQAEGLELEYYAKTCCQTGRCSECEGKCGKMSRSMTMKNATNRDAESVSYWRTMQNIQDESLEISQEEWEAMGGTQFQRRPTDRLSDLEVLNAAADGLEGLSLTEAEENSLGVMRQKLSRLAPISDQIEEHERLAEEYAERDPEEAQKERNRAIVLKTKRTRELNSILAGANGPIMRRVLQKARSIVERQELTEYRASRKESELAKRYKARIEKDVNELIAWGMKPDTKNAMKHIPEGIKGPVMDFLEAIDFSSKRKLAGGEATQKDERFLEKMATLKKVLEPMRPNGEENLDKTRLSEEFFVKLDDLSNNITRTAQAIHSFDAGVIVNEMESSDLKRLADIIKGLKRLITEYNRTYKNAVYESIDKAGKNSVEMMQKMKPLKSNAATEFLEFDQTRPAYIFERFGEGGKSIWQELQNGQSRFGFMAKEIIDFSEKTYTAKEVKAWEKEVKTIKLSDDSTVEMTIAQIMSLYKLQAREQALGHLLGNGIRIPNYKIGNKKYTDNGHFLNQEDIDNICGVLTARQKAVADKLQAFMQETGSQWGNEVTMVRFGERLFGEKNYFPIHSDGGNIPGTLDEHLESQSLYAMLNMGFTKRTQEGANNRIIVHSIFDEYAAHMSNMAKYNAFALPVLDTLRWLNYTDEQNPNIGVRQEMARVYGRRSGSDKATAELFVTNLLKALNGTENASLKKTEQTAIRLLGRYNRAQVAANLSVAIQQPLSVIRSVEEFGVGSLIVAMGTNTKAIRKNWKEMEGHSGIAVWKQLGFYDINISRGLSSMIKHDESTVDKLTEWSMGAASFADRLTWGWMWEIAKQDVKQKKKLKPSDEGYWDAVTKAFEDVIFKTQVVDSPLTKTEAMRNNSFWAKSIYSFMSEPITALSMTTNAVSQFRRGIAEGKSTSELWRTNGKKMGRTFMVNAVSLVINAAVTAALRDALRDDDEYENYGEKFMQAFRKNLFSELIPLNNIPELSGMLNGVLLTLKDIGVIEGEFADSIFEEKSTTESILDAIKNAVYIPYQKIWGKGSNYTWYGAVYNALKAASGITGLPAASGIRELVTMWNNTMAPILGKLYPKSEWVLRTYKPDPKQEIREAYESGYLTDEEALEAMQEKKVSVPDSYLKTPEVAYKGYLRYWAYKSAHPKDDSVDDTWFIAYGAKGVDTAGINLDTYLSYRKKGKGLDSKKDILPIINGMNITKAQKDALYKEHTNWSVDALSEAPWH